LLEFNAEKSNKKVKLNWITASEINNDYFTIERSIDGKNFTAILTRKGAGNSSQAHYYSNYDYNPLNGISYYRLKQTDFDGRFTYSDIKSVQFETNEDNTVEIYPNPVINNTFKINLDSDIDENVIITIYNSIGQQIYQNEKSLNKGKNEIKIDLDENYAPGSYLIELWNSRIGTIQKHIQF
jgi:hypothetical protein